MAASVGGAKAMVGLDRVAAAVEKTVVAVVAMVETIVVVENQKPISHSSTVEKVSKTGAANPLRTPEVASPLAMSTRSILLQVLHHYS